MKEPEEKEARLESLAQQVYGKPFKDLAPEIQDRMRVYDEENWNTQWRPPKKNTAT